MKTTYLVWKDPNCNGVNVEWQNLSRAKFLTLVKDPANSGRYFIKLWSTNEDGSDGAIVMEATEEVYKDWRKEKRHTQHLRDSDPGYTLVSYHQMETEDGCYGEELLPDPDCDVEDSSIHEILLESLAAAKSTLSVNELWLLDKIYREEKSLSEIGELLGMSKVAVFKRLNKILAKLKNHIF
ncbi:MAG: hypothetical protein LBQ48_01470 [Oscillospiraceae bacterium]|jgi:hypothetical protein|nr:hypothetical protein [Oscillospiraceae bacterium]